jgi:hypothetical protein
MKKTMPKLLIIILFNLLVVAKVYAQLPAASLETLIIDLWPDYDQPAVLVLLTGTLPADTPLPAAVTIPVPNEAQIHAVARITGDNRMVDDIEYTTGDNSLTFTTPDPSFRVEYYVPYQSIGSIHSYSFDWLADIRVEEVLAAVQQPTGASNISVTPDTAVAVPRNADGFTYYALPAQAIPAGELYTIGFTYEMVSPPQLSIDNLPAAPAAVVGTPSASPSSGSTALSDIDWRLVLGVLGIVIMAVVVTWIIATRQTAARQEVRKPRPKRAQATAKTKSSTGTAPARFCRECGNGLNPGDKFCRKCGTAVK